MASSHISLIGMPAVGKTTIGKALAKSLGWKFIDTDTLLIKNIGMPLQPYIDAHGPQALNDAEEQTVLSLNLDAPTVISTGGSVVYQHRAMEHLKSISTVIYLHDSLENIKARMLNIDQRGITGLAEKGLDGLFNERSILYKRYKDATVSVSPFHKDNIIASITDILKLSPHEYT